MSKGRKISPTQEKELLSLYSKKAKAMKDYDQSAAETLEKKNAVKNLNEQADALLEEIKTGQKRLFEDPAE